MYADDNIENQDNPMNDNEIMHDSTELETELNSNNQAITLIEPSFKLVSGYTVPQLIFYVDYLVFDLLYVYGFY